MGEGRCHWRVLREKGYHLTLSTSASAAVWRLECRGQGRKQGGELGVVVEIQVRNGCVSQLQLGRCPEHGQGKVAAGDVARAPGRMTCPQPGWGELWAEYALRGLSGGCDVTS